MIVERLCPTCNTIFETKQLYAKTRIYCNSDCEGAARYTFSTYEKFDPQFESLDFYDDDDVSEAVNLEDYEAPVDSMFKMTCTGSYL